MPQMWGEEGGKDGSMFKLQEEVLLLSLHKETVNFLLLFFLKILESKINLFCS